ncbi:MAG: tol-pal system-associated acyl-CoA thioesterase [Rubrimonas sp.]|uniref:tol-pal system-associated acyl-CoA thioesterase n=1 Tax=Rubrimonas sp. TaxID=2036015 RepID=UPI002FDDD8A4
MAAHRLDLRVYYEDTDLAGIVYYANYLKFLERGRTEALRAVGVDQSAMKAGGLVFAVTRVEIDYRRSARFDDLLTVETALSRLGGASVEMVQRVLRGDETLAPARVRVACMTPEGRPARMPDPVRAALARLPGA